MKNNQWWTDCPLYTHEQGQKAPLRCIEVLAYDGDKYCKIKYNNEVFEVKNCYIYPKKRRFRAVKASKTWHKLINKLEKLGLEYYENI